MTAYRIVRDNPTCEEGKAGEIVYPFKFTDYGTANEDTRSTGVKHVSVTYDPKGGCPFFTIPQCILDLIIED